MLSDNFHNFRNVKSAPVCSSSPTSRTAPRTSCSSATTSGSTVAIRSAPSRRSASIRCAAYNGTRHPRRRRPVLTGQPARHRDYELTENFTFRRWANTSSPSARATSTCGSATCSPRARTASGRSATWTAWRSATPTPSAKHHPVRRRQRLLHRLQNAFYAQDQWAVHPRLAVTAGCAST